MADCGYKFINNDKINKAIVSMANNNISYGFSLAAIYKSDNFRTYVSKDQVAHKYKFEDIEIRQDLAGLDRVVLGRKKLQEDKYV
mgnify:CR=1 FL=1